MSIQKQFWVERDKRLTLRREDAAALANIAATQRKISAADEVDGLVAVSSLIHVSMSDGESKPSGLRQAAREARESRIDWGTPEGLDALQALLWADPNSDEAERAFLEMAVALHESPDSTQSRWIRENDDILLDAALLQRSERSIWPARTAMVHAGLVGQGLASESLSPRTAWPADLAMDVLQAAAQGGIFNPEDSPEALYALAKQAGGDRDRMWNVYRSFGWKAYTKDMVLDASSQNPIVARGALVALAACTSTMLDGPRAVPGSDEEAGMIEVWRGACAGCFTGIMHSDSEVRKQASGVSLSMRGDWDGERAKAFDAALVPDVMGLMH